MKKAGSEKEAFDTIVASGARSALPHGRASEKPLEAGDFITFDFGGRARQGYNSDLTRTVVLGKASRSAARDLRGGAGRAAGGARCAPAGDDRQGGGPGSAEPDHRPRLRRVSSATAWGTAWAGSVHDGGGLSQRIDMTLAPGMVMTVEPGV